jgi:hypothetical protein
MADVAKAGNLVDSTKTATQGATSSPAATVAGVPLVLVGLGVGFLILYMMRASGARDLWR